MGTTPKHAIVVAHGIGQQRPYEALDSFTHGLAGKDPNAKIEHCKTDNPFAHFIRLNSNELNVDIYELYWAPLAAGATSYAGVAEWIGRTALTPLLRLPYNVDLIIIKAVEAVKEFRDNKRPTGNVPIPPADRSFEAVKRTIAEARGLVLYLAASLWPTVKELVREIWRIVYLSFAAVILLFVTAYVVTNASALAKQFWGGAGKALGWSTWAAKDWITVAVFIGALEALIALLLSYPGQLEDYYRLKLRSPRGSAVTEISGRKILLFAIPILAVLLAGLLWHMATIGESRFLSQVVRRSWDALVKSGSLRSLVITVALVLVSFYIKRAYVDFIGDIAVYTTADENSAFYKTRMSILNDAVSKIRLILKNPDYESVTLAGHSLGSVIVYDSLCWLRVEFQVEGSNKDRITEREYDKVRNLVTFGSPLDKVVYFFRTTVPSSQTIRMHILDEVHGLRRPAASLNDRQIHDQKDFVSGGSFNWLNVYYPWDPVSAPLHYFEKVDDQPLRSSLWGICHTKYWRDGRFYDRVLRLLTSSSSPRNRRPGSPAAETIREPKSQAV